MDKNEIDLIDSDDDDNTHACATTSHQSQSTKKINSVIKSYSSANDNNSDHNSVLNYDENGIKFDDEINNSMPYTTTTTNTTSALNRSNNGHESKNHHANCYRDTNNDSLMMNGKDDNEIDLDDVYDDDTVNCHQWDDLKNASGMTSSVSL